MNAPYLVVDLEATCDRDHAIPRDQTEIIEIGAVLVDRDTLAPRGEFQTFVRPVLHPRLTEFCTELTSITQADVERAPLLRQALAQLERWLPGPVTLASWGAYDHAQFRREARRKRLRLPWGNDHLDIKQAFARRVGRRMGVGAALRRVGLSLEGTPHRGIDDARNVVRLLPHALGMATGPRPRHEPVTEDATRHW
ncbi:MAG: exonuclease domain-containing protein [Myxococcales bacterium]|nr:exonuclease domain-containing protein [Myxococcales bacterium]